LAKIIINNQPFNAKLCEVGEFASDISGDILTKIFGIFKLSEESKETFESVISQGVIDLKLPSEKIHNSSRISYRSVQCLSEDIPEAITYTYHVEFRQVAKC
jgi:hypothetical protein